MACSTGNSGATVSICADHEALQRQYAALATQKRNECAALATQKQTDYATLATQKRNECAALETQKQNEYAALATQKPSACECDVLQTRCRQAEARLARQLQEQADADARSEKAERESLTKSNFALSQATEQVRKLTDELKLVREQLQRACVKVAQQQHDAQAVALANKREVAQLMRERDEHGVRFRLLARESDELRRECGALHRERDELCNKHAAAAPPPQPSLLANLVRQQLEHLDSTIRNRDWELDAVKLDLQSCQATLARTKSKLATCRISLARSMTENHALHAGVAVANLCFTTVAAEQDSGYDSYDDDDDDVPELVRDFVPCAAAAAAGVKQGE